MSMKDRTVQELLRQTPNTERTEQDLDSTAVRKLSMYLEDSGYEPNERRDLYFLYDLLRYTEGA